MTDTITVDLTRDQALVLVEAALFTVTRSDSTHIRPELADQLVAAAMTLQEAIDPTQPARHLQVIR